MFEHPRLPNWERRLAAYLAEPGNDNFEYGVQDCALFGCGAVMAMTGHHPAPQFVGAYDDLRGAAEALQRLGAGTLVKTFSATFEQKHTGFAQRGDLVFAEGAIGVCMGKDGVFLTETEGFARRPRSAFTVAWRV